MLITEHRGQRTDERKTQFAPPALAGPLVNAGGRLRNPQGNGFTLIETVITLVILSIAAVGVLSVFATGIGGSADPLIQNQAVQLAQEKMDAIMGDKLNPARGFAWVVAADYNTNLLKYTPENPIAGFPSFSRGVTIFCVTAANLNFDTATGPPCASGYAHVTVTVTHASAGSVSADTLVTNY